jgi:hypothetical protein
MHGAIPSLSQYVFMAWCLVKYAENFTFYQSVGKVIFIVKLSFTWYSKYGKKEFMILR